MVFELPRVQNDPKIVPEWLPGDLWAALGRRGRFLSDFESLLGSQAPLEKIGEVGLCLVNQADTTFSCFAGPDWPLAAGGKEFFVDCLGGVLMLFCELTFCALVALGIVFEDPKTYFARYEPILRITAC